MFPRNLAVHIANATPRSPESFMLTALQVAVGAALAAALWFYFSAGAEGRCDPRSAMPWLTCTEDGL